MKTLSQEAMLDLIINPEPEQKARIREHLAGKANAQPVIVNKALELEQRLTQELGSR